jgi:hypothetical protein
MSETRVLLALAPLLLVPAARAQTLDDDFSAYANGSDLSPRWEATSIGWEARDGMVVASRAEGFLLCKEAGYGTSIAIEAVVRCPSATPGTGWGVAGLRITQDAANAYGLNLVVSPEKDGGRRFVELHEMYNGTWLAEGLAGTTLTRLEDWVAPGWEWQAGEAYRLRLALTRATVEGTVSALTGEVRARFRLGLDANVGHVDRGWAGLSASNLDAEFDDARVEVAEPTEAPTVPAADAYPPYNVPAQAAGPKLAATGYFHVEKVDGRWWVADPLGQPTFMVGTDHCNYRAHFCQKLGYAPYNRSCEAKYGGPEPWAELATSRLKSWNFNLLGAGSCAETHNRGLAYTAFASLGSGFATREYIAKPINWTGFPDVFSPRFEAWSKLQARQVVGATANDPWLFGTFIDNELEWFGKSGKLVDDVFLLPAEQPAKQALVAYLTERYGSIGKLNAALGTSFADVDALAATTIAPASGRELDAIRSEFLSRIAERYFSVTCAALRAADPNHMILGCRFAGVAPKEVLAAAGRWVDIFTINTYPRVEMADRRVLDTPAMLAEIHEATGRPMMITEWSFPALDAGLPSKNGAGMRVDTQEQKALCYDIFATTIAKLPFMVGYDYFMWVDEPALGISDTFPEDSNYGLVDVNDDPWEVLVERATEVNAQVPGLHAESPLDLGWIAEPPAQSAVRFGPAEMEARGAERSDESALAWDLGPLRVSREAGDGAVLSRIDAGTLHLGSLAAVVQQAQGGGYQWPRADRDVSVASWTADGLHLADVTVAHVGSPSSTPYEITYRLVGREGLPCVFVQVRAVRNTGDQPLTMESYFLYVLPSIGGSPDGDGVGGPGGVPNYYLPSACWTDAALGGWLGAAPLDPSTFDASFWKGPSKEGDFHADFRRKVGVTIEPGAAWEAKDEPWAAVYGFGPGEPEGWKSMAATDAEWKRVLRGLGN